MIKDLVKEYKRVRALRNSASASNDLFMADAHNAELEKIYAELCKFNTEDVKRELGV